MLVERLGRACRDKQGISFCYDGSVGSGPYRSVKVMFAPCVTHDLGSDFMLYPEEHRTTESHIELCRWCLDRPNAQALTHRFV